MQECLSYFKNPGYLRLFKLFLKKYQSYQKITGTIRLSNLSQEEADCLSGWFGEYFEANQNYLLKVSKFKKALAESKFNQFELETILANYLGKPLVTNKEKMINLQNDKDLFFKQLIQEFDQTIISSWLNYLYTNKTKAYNYLITNQDNLTLIKQTLKALCHLPIYNNKYERIDVFASRYTGDPHSFDEGKCANQILKYGIQYLFNLLATTNNAKDRYELFISAGLLKDDLSNLILVYNLTPQQGNRAGWMGFNQVNEPIWICLRNLTKITSFELLKGIYVVENPSVFDQLISLKLKNYAFICSNGQPTLITYVLLDKLKDQVIYYAGDFDPEGLLIAQRLIDEYPHIKLWHYDDYPQRFSTKIDNNRLSQLQKLTHPQLMSIANIINDTQSVLYQEDLIQLYLSDFQ